MPADYPHLPLSGLHADFSRALKAGSLLLEAEPGAGKSTLAPLWALDSIAGEVWLVQPRVLAALSLARRLSALLGERVGETVGYQVPFEHKASRRTRLRLMTPGIFLQRLLTNPELAGVGCVMLDEIHERSVDQDTGWALLQEAAILNGSLAVVLMSATPDAALRRQVATALYAPGRCHPVSLAYCPPLAMTGQRRPEPIAQHVLRALASAAGWQQQTVLVFLPGWQAIEECRRALAKAHPGLCVQRLHSRVARAEQARALDDNAGPRVILATNIAETSLTIADVTLVVDSGLVREPDFEQRTGVTRLQTRRVSAASAEQRRGRAGRVRAGHCIRLWAESEALAPQTLPAIRRCDYLPLALRLAHWGTPVEQLPWLEAPNPLALASANHRLTSWGFLAADGAITPLGEQVARLGTHPRIAAMLLHGEPRPGWLLLALALHFDLPAEASLEAWLNTAEAEFRHNKQWRKLAQRWQRVLDVTATPAARLAPLPPALADRLAGLFVARLGRRTTSGRYRLNSGISVALACQADWALVLHISRRGQAHQGMGLAIAPSPARIRELAVPQARLSVAGSGKRRRWIEHSAFYLGGQVVDEQQRELADAEIPDAILAVVREQGLAHIHWPQTALTFLLRARWAQQLELLTLPALDEARLTQRLAHWLGGFLHADSDIDKLPLREALACHVGFEHTRRLDACVPETLSLPSGRVVRIDYQDGASAARLVAGEYMPLPCVAAKLQEFFGAEQLGPDDLPLQLKLLSPAGRPLAITRDLAYFWREVYPQVRREVRGRYAKHPWPQDPLAHVATHKTKRALQ